MSGKSFAPPLALAAASLLPLCAAAQSGKTLHIVVPFAAGAPGFGR